MLAQGPAGPGARRRALRRERVNKFVSKIDTELEKRLNKIGDLTVTEILKIRQTVMPKAAEPTGASAPRRPPAAGRNRTRPPPRARTFRSPVAEEVFTPHGGGQVDVLADKHRFQVLRAGRRWGKTKVGARKLLRRAINHPDSLCWWIANSYRNVRRGYAEVVRQIPRELLAKPAPAPTAQELVLQLVNGSRIEFYSAGNPDALAGAGVDSVVFDEAALADEGVWFQLVRPTLMDTGGDALLISTPRGRNWFYRLDMKGRNPTEPDFKSWHFPQQTNPYVPDEESDERAQRDARRALPPGGPGRVRQQRRVDLRPGDAMAP